MNKIEQLQAIFDDSSRIVFFTGAGVSTESGIPDFRSVDGLYNMKYKYPPEEIISNSFFWANPEEFYRFYRDKMIIRGVKPNPAHLKMAEFEKAGKALGVVTQNIDGLHTAAGSVNVSELHGTTYKNHCTKCGKYYSLEDILDMDNVPRCSCGAIIKPDVVLYDNYNGVELVKGSDYTLSYRNNTKPGTATLTIKGKGNYQGTLTAEFTITTSDLNALSASAKDKAYSKKKDAYKSAIVIVDSNGKKLKAGTDYDKKLTYTVDGQEVPAKSVLPAGTLVKVTATGKGNYTGTVEAYYRVVAADIKNAKVKVPAQVYTGSEIEVDKAEISVKLNGEQLSAEDFTIVSYENNVNKGTAKITLQGLGNYGGTKTVKFKIVQKSFINALWLLFN